MKKTTQSKGNVFADIGIPNAGEHALKADVVIKLARMIELKDISHSEAAKLTGIAQPDLSTAARKVRWILDGSADAGTHGAWQ